MAQSSYCRNYDDPEFDSFMATIDDILWDKVQLFASDLPDQPWRRWFEEGWKPRGAAKKAVRRAGGTW